MHEGTLKLGRTMPVIVSKGKDGGMVCLVSKCGLRSYFTKGKAYGIGDCSSLTSLLHSMLPINGHSLFRECNHLTDYLKGDDRN